MEIIMKKSIVILLLLTMILSLFCACQSENDTEPAKESETESETNMISVTNEIILSQKDGHYSVDGAMMSFFFNEKIMNWYQQYGAYASYFNLDFSKSLKIQTHSEDKTWYDYFYERTETELMLYIAYANAAHEKGFELDDENMEDIDKLVETLEQTIDAYGLSYSDFYGADVDGDVVRRCYEIVCLASEYADRLYEEFETVIESDEKRLLQYVADNKDVFGDELDKTLTKDLAYVISSDKAIIESVISDFMSGTNKTRDVLEDLGKQASDALPENSKVEMGYGSEERIAPGMFEANFLPMEEWLKTAQEDTFSGLIEIKPTSGTGKTYYAVIYFEKYNVEAWRATAIAGLVDQMLRDWYQGEDGNGGIKAEKPFTVNKEVAGQLFETKVPHFLENVGK